MSKYTIVTLDSVESTNSYVLEHIASFADRSVIYTKKQTSGRGRFNRKWVADDTENLYMSIVLKPEDVSSYPFPNLTQYLSVVVCKLLEKSFALTPCIKWPNDILVNGCKISGILAETYMKNNKIDAVVLGLGLNINLSEKTVSQIDQKATSIYCLKHQNYNVDEILENISNLFFSEYDEFVKNGFSFIKQEYIAKCNFLGGTITIKDMDKQQQFFAKSIDDNGFLIVVDKYNNESKIITGDVLC